MSCQLLTILFLTSLAQERSERRPIPAPPARGQVVNVRVGIAGNGEIRQITLSMPAPADEDDEPPAPRNIHFNILTSVVGPENFDRWLFADEQSEEDRNRHLDDILRSIFAKTLSRSTTMRRPSDSHPGPRDRDRYHAVED
jgi:hypothetical protein